MTKRKITMLICATAFYLVFITPVFFHFPIEARACILLIIMQILWIGRVFSLGYSSVILMLILSFHFMSFQKVLGFVGTPVVWLLFATYLLSGGFIYSGLAHRLSLQMFSWSKGSGRKIVASSFILMSLLSIMIPSNIGRASLVTSVLEKIITSIRQVEQVSKLPKVLFLSVCYVTALTGAFLATGASSTIYTFGIINDSSSVHFTFLTWLIFMAPPIIIFMVILWILLNILYPLEKINTELAVSFIDKELTKAGQMKPAEFKMLAIVICTVLLWILQPLHHFSIPLIGLLGAAATIFPGIGVWNWGAAKIHINWDMILFFASTLMLSNVLITSGLLKWVSHHMVALINAKHIILMLLVFIILIFLIRLFFVNVLGIMTFIIPLSFSIGDQIHGVSPILFPLTFFLAGVPGFYLITQSPVHMISFSYGYFTEKDLIKTGVMASVIWLIILMVTAIFYWNDFLLR